MRTRNVPTADVPHVSVPRRAEAVLAATLLGLVLGALGPFGNYLNGGILVRSAYWVGAMWLGLVFYGGAAAIGERCAKAGSWRRRALLDLAVPVASLPQAAITRTAALMIWPDLHRHDPGWWTWYAQATMIGAIAMFGAGVMRNTRSRRSPPAVSSEPFPPVAVAVGLRTAASDGWPVPLPVDVVALQMEDHDVRIHTRTGSTLLHMPLLRAIERIAPLEGLRTHRSWWVARHAVARVDGSPRSMRLHLTNGLSAPVARGVVATLRAAGWLDAGSAIRMVDPRA